MKLLFIALLTFFQACDSSDHSSPQFYREPPEEQREDFDRQELDEQHQIDERKREVKVEDLR